MGAWKVFIMQTIGGYRVVRRHMLTRQMLTRQMLTRQMLTTLMEKETFAHNFFYNLVSIVMLSDIYIYITSLSYNYVIR